MITVDYSCTAVTKTKEADLTMIPVETVNSRSQLYSYRVIKAEDMSMDSGDNVVWFQNDEGHYLIKKVQVDILD